MKRPCIYSFFEGVAVFKGETLEKNVFLVRIQEDLKVAIKARDKGRVNALRMLITALKNAELEEREALSEEQELAILGSYARRCRESIGEFEKAGREDLLEESRAELEIVMAYLPRQLTEDEISDEAQKVIEETGASGPRDIGRVMGVMMKKLKGRVDGNSVKEAVSKLLASD